MREMRLSAAICSLSVYRNGTPFFVSSVSGDEVVAKLGTKSLNQLHAPRKDCISLTHLGCSLVMRSANLVRSGLMP